MAEWKPTKAENPNFKCRECGSGERRGWLSAVDALDEMAKAMDEKAETFRSQNPFDPATTEESDAATTGWVLEQAAKLLRERALIPEAPREGWQPISSAPKDGTVVDLWHEDFGRQANFKWGHTEHSCGEAGRYCDSDWHSEEAGWVETALNERYFAEDVFTHWRPLPPPPQDREPGHGA